MRRLLWSLVGLALVAVLALGGVFFYRNAIVRWALHRGTEAALQVDTDIKSVRVALDGSALDIRSFRIENPKGFESKYFLILDEIDFELDTGSVFDDLIVIPRLTISGVSINAERAGGRMNYDAIVQAMSSPPASSDAAADAASGPSVVIRELLIRDVSADVTLTALRVPVKQRVSVPEIRLRNVGSESDGGLLMSELTRVVVAEVLKGLGRGSLTLPAEAAALLRQNLKTIGRISANPGDLRQSAAAIEDAARALGGDAGQAAGDAIQNLRGLLGGQKSD